MILMWLQLVCLGAGETAYVVASCCNVLMVMVDDDDEFFRGGAVAGTGSLGLSPGSFSFLSGQ